MSDATPRDDIPNDILSQDRNPQRLTTDYSGQFSDEDQINDGDTYVTDEDLSTDMSNIPRDKELDELTGRESMG